MIWWLFCVWLGTFIPMAIGFAMMKADIRRLERIVEGHGPVIQKLLQMIERRKL